MSKLTDTQKEDLNDLRTILISSLQRAQTITLSFDDEDTRGDDFYTHVESDIEDAITEIDNLLTLDAEAAD